eukprot:1150773-Pelagomonas_calceolata.AAC.4
MRQRSPFQKHAQLVWAGHPTLQALGSFSGRGGAQQVQGAQPPPAVQLGISNGLHNGGTGVWTIASLMPRGIAQGQGAQQLSMSRVALRA